MDEERTGVRRYFRADAAFAKPEVYEYLEERRVLYTIRLPSNEVLQREIAPLLKRPVGRPPKRPIIWYDDCWYQAGSWDRPRRVVAKVEWHRGELFPRVGFIVTNMSASIEGVVHFYNGRGTAEQWIKEGKYALNWTRLSCHRFVANQVPSVAVHPGLQPWELPAQTMSAQGGQGLVVARPPSQAHQDRGQASSSRATAGVPAGRGGCAACAVPGSAGSHRQVMSGAWLKEGRFSREGGGRSWGVVFLLRGSGSPWRAAMAIKMDKKGGLRPKSCLLVEVPGIDRHRKTSL